ncbi:MAG: hypothetical protein NTY38_33035 [Acidobacteria bacterium]|nr:hypothetical protein [Acidobacteriota bacterium]
MRQLAAGVFQGAVRLHAFREFRGALVAKSHVFYGMIEPDEFDRAVTGEALLFVGFQHAFRVLSLHRDFVSIELIPQSLSPLFR